MKSFDFYFKQLTCGFIYPGIQKRLSALPEGLQTFEHHLKHFLICGNFKQFCGDWIIVLSDYNSRYRLMHEKRDKSILRIFINEKFRKLFYFFTCILPNYLTHESQKDFWKNSHFENTRAGFLLWCQNSLWQNTSKMMHFQAWKNKDFMQYYVVPFDPIKIFTH